MLPFRWKYDCGPTGRPAWLLLVAGSPRARVTEGTHRNTWAAWSLWSEYQFHHALGDGYQSPKAARAACAAYMMRLLATEAAVALGEPPSNRVWFER